MFDELVFDSVAQLKFRIVKKLTTLPRATYTYYELAEKVNLSYQQFYKLIHEIDNELLSAKGIEQSLIIPNTGISLDNLALTIDEYRFFLLERSLPFQLLRALLLEPELGIDQFCHQQFVSRATLSRRIQPLLSYLRRYQISINFQQFNIKGPELAIRLALFYFFWIGYRNLHWPFEIDSSKIESYGKPFLKFSSLKRNFVGTLEVKMYSAVALTRIKQGKLASYDSSLDFLFENNLDFDLTLFVSSLALTHEESKGEAASIYLLANFLPFYENKKDPGIQQTINMFSKNPNVVWEFVEIFREFVFNELNIALDEDTKKFMMANLANVMLGFYSFRGPFPNLPYLMKKPSAKSADSLYLEEKIRHFLIDVTKKEPFSVFQPSISPLVQVLRNGISSFYYELVKDLPLTVGVVVESNLVLAKPLIDFLLSINFIDVAYYQENRTYDFIISTFSKFDSPVIVYHWDYNEGYDHMAALYTALREAYLKKNR